MNGQRGGDKMLISVLICTFNRCDSLGNTLDSLLNQECDSAFGYEVIVIDNNSQDRTKEVVENYIAKFGKKLRYIFEPAQGLSIARNRGIKEANGDIVAFTDDDVIADSKWLLNIARCFREYKCDALGGRILPLFPPNAPRWIKKNTDILNGPLVCNDRGEADLICDGNNDSMPFVGANIAFDKRCFDKHGLFKTDLGVGAASKGLMGEETEYFSRLQKAGQKLYYCGKALVWHRAERSRMSYRYIAKWFFASGKYYAKADFDGSARRPLVCYFGIPRCFIRDAVEQITLLFLNLFNKRKFLRNFCRFFCYFGMCYEYKRLNYSKIRQI